MLSFVFLSVPGCHVFSFVFLWFPLCSCVFLCFHVLSYVFLCVPMCPCVPFNQLFSVFSCVFLCFPLFSYGFPCGSCAFLDSFVLLCSPVFSYYLQCPCGFMCCPLCSSPSFVVICFHCHCHCFICVKLFQKQSWECGFNSSWFKTPFEQYAYKVFVIIFFDNPALIEKHFFY